MTTCQLVIGLPGLRIRPHREPHIFNVVSALSQGAETLHAAPTLA